MLGRPVVGVTVGRKVPVVEPSLIDDVVSVGDVAVVACVVGGSTVSPVVVAVVVVSSAGGGGGVGGGGGLHPPS